MPTPRQHKRHHHHQHQALLESLTWPLFQGKARGRGGWQDQPRRPEWTCEACGTTNFMDRSVCRWCTRTDTLDAKSKNKGKGKGQGSEAPSSPHFKRRDSGTASSIGTTTVDQRDKNTPPKSPQEKADEAKVAIASRKKLLALAGENGLDNHDFVRQLQNEVDALEKKATDSRSAARKVEDQRLFVARQRKRCEQAEKNLLEATQDKTKQDQLLATAQIELEKFEEQLKKDLNGSSADVAMNGEDVLIPMDETEFLSPDEHAKQLNEITTEFIKRKATQGDTPEQKQVLEREYHIEIGRLHKRLRSGE